MGREQRKNRAGILANQLMAPTDMKMISVDSPDLDDRISYLLEEIDQGKKDPQIRNIAASVLSRRVSGAWAVPERDWRAEVDALYGYVRDNVRYTRDIQDVELFQRPARTLELGIGDCDDLSILLGSLLQSVGYPIILRVIALNGGPYQHIYVVAGIPPDEPTEWRPLDASRPEGPGWELKEDVSDTLDYIVD